MFLIDKNKYVILIDLEGVLIYKKKYWIINIRITLNQ